MVFLIYIYIYMDTTVDHFTPLALRVRGNYISINLRKLVTSDISDVATTSVHSEKTRLKKVIMIIILLV